MDAHDFVDSKSLKHYLEEIAKFPPISDAEEQELGRSIRRGDESAKRRLVEGNLKFVVSYVKKYAGMGLSLLDLINEGNLGLMEAARRYDVDRGVKFITYAVWWIRQAVIHALTHNSRIYSLPQKLSDRISMMRKKKEKLKTKLDREPTREEVAESMGLTPLEVADLEILAEKGVSLSDHMGSDELTVEERLGDQTEPSVEDKLVKASLETSVHEMLEGLEGKEALVLKWRFGLDGLPPRTLQKIGEELKLTRERVRQIERKAMRKLAQSQKVRQLRGYLN
ncbi:MAG: RNA polymerase sigma factor RpoD/SigA [Candidatus Aminicenantes bacterium]|nr:RNA polymerase sigma factor RpoD/SigA [Candidatus Aminicenantes bacterium]